MVMICIDAPEHVGEQDELLTSVVGDVPGRGEELDGAPPFVLGEPHLAQERVQMTGERLHQFLQARIRGVVEGRDHALHEA